ncbi:hypothetical protein BDM02DRAFT_3192157 [Thelephora ganbajun]|uniref:Uncharacterized protein n=1 Tax=Thelephora ganbajun TaxID=370292 RepID=A0ACB6Z097_THEGA|nr:hypothetical protein BDM02DRAFT_3192157 [Thelephora ganbajun]
MSTVQKRSRACDSCRRKKVRCDGSDVSGGPCATCAIYSIECTYNDHLKPPRPRGYVQRLENRIANLERLLREARSRSSQGGTGDSSSPTSGGAPTKSRASGDQHNLGPLPASAYSKPEDMDPLSLLAEETSDSDDEFFSLTETNLGTPGSLREPAGERTSRFYGKSSLLAFTSRAFDESGEAPPTNRARIWREEFWTTPDWLIPLIKPKPVLFEFPDTDLLWNLVDCYFDNSNVMFPMLHRPSFVRSIQQGLHEINQGFGAVVLLVCAIGCRFTNDPRVVQVISPGSSCTAWKFFHQVNKIQKHRYLPHSLYEAQVYPLTAMFLEGYSPPDVAWMIVAVGLRVMQDTGVHRKSFSSQKMLETELWKRSFWSLVILDRSLSTLLGRPCILQDEDFDTDLPLICDDKDLDESSLKSPSQADRPTQMCGFVRMIKLSQILAFALRTVYSTKRSRALLGYVGEQWERNVITTLESALNRWLDTVPEHLRWGSEASKESRVFLIQSAYLRCQFHEIQFHVHRVFALRDPPDPELSASSMIVCKNAAKQCIALVDSAKDLLFISLHCFGFMKPIFGSIVFLIILSWKTGGIEDDSPEYHAIETGTKLVDLTSERWRASLCLREILRVLRGLAGGSYGGWIPRVEDLYRLQSEAVMYIDRDGVASSLSGHGRPSTRAGTKITNPLVQTTVPTTNQGAEKLNNEHKGTSGTGPIQPDGFSSIDFLANSTSFSFGTPVSSLAKDEESGRPHKLDRNDMSLFPMELMMYNDLMMDIGGTTRFFDQDFRNSILFGSIPTPPPATEDTRSVQDTEFRGPNTMYE